MFSAGSFLSDSSFYVSTLSNAGNAAINKKGTTQFRLHFTFGDSDNLADYITLYSGDAAGTANRPTLTVYFNP